MVRGVTRQTPASRLTCFENGTYIGRPSVKKKLIRDVHHEGIHAHRWAPLCGIFVTAFAMGIDPPTCADADYDVTPCCTVDLPVSVQVTGSESFVATALLPGNELPCRSTRVDTLALDSSGRVAQGTFATGINQGSSACTRASGPEVAVPNVLRPPQVIA
jgi:hypothetical protein